MYRVYCWEGLGAWQVGITFTPTAEEKLQGREGFAESAVVQLKEGRDADLGAMQAMLEALEGWLLVVGETTR